MMQWNDALFSDAYLQVLEGSAEWMDSVLFAQVKDNLDPSYTRVLDLVWTYFGTKK